MSHNLPERSEGERVIFTPPRCCSLVPLFLPLIRLPPALWNSIEELWGLLPERMCRLACPCDPGIFMTHAGRLACSASLPAPRVSSLHELADVHGEAVGMLVAGVAEAGSTDTHLLWPLAGISLHSSAHVLQISRNDTYCCF